MDIDILNKGKSTEAESVISRYAESVLFWGRILAIAVALLVVIFDCIDAVKWGVHSIHIITLPLAIFWYFVIRGIAKLIWATITLFVNISTTLKRIEIKLEQDASR